MMHTPKIGLCMTRSHGTKLHILVRTLHSGTSNTMLLPLFWKSHCATYSPACVILYHVTGSCKGPIKSRAVQLSVERIKPFFWFWFGFTIMVRDWPSSLIVGNWFGIGFATLNWKLLWCVLLNIHAQSNFQLWPHLLSDQFSKIPNVSMSNHYISNLL